jgi:hypothetical protein
MKLPLKLRSENQNVGLEDAAGEWLAWFAKEDAETIVRAVNNHAELLKGARETIEACLDCADLDCDSAAHQTLREAIAKSER